MFDSKLTLSILPNKLSVCRMASNAKIPSWATSGTFFSISKTDDELSIVCPEKNVPLNIKSEKNWRALKVNGPLDFSLTGILSLLANPLAKAEISIFAISTFDTDYILVKRVDLKRTIGILSKICNINMEK